MPIPLPDLLAMQDKRVRIRFDDDMECIATLIHASQEMDGSLHVIYHRVEWANDPRELATARGSTVYAEGESLLTIEEMQTGN